MISPGLTRNKPPPGILPLESILDSFGEAIEIIDAEWNLVYVNQAAADFSGKDALELRGKNIWEEFPEVAGSPIEHAIRRAMREQVRVDFEFYFPTGDKWFEIHLHPTPQYLTLHATDITRRRQAEARVGHQAKIEALNALQQHTIEQASAVNEALILSGVRQHELTEAVELLNARLHRAMMEAHHRIKNNLQVVSALVELQIGETGETGGDVYLKRINQHIRTLASIHDLLSQQAKVSAEAEYLGTRDLLAQLVPMLQETSGGRRITADIADIVLPVQQAASLSLLVSECVSNGIKHSKGGIEITLRVEGVNALLEVCDNGIGFPPEFDWRDASHTGLSLIDGTARYDLRGEVRYENHSKGGGCVTITFPIPVVTGSTPAPPGTGNGAHPPAPPGTGGGAKLRA